MKQLVNWLTLTIIFTSTVVFSDEQEMADEQSQYWAEAQNIWDSLDRQSGKITLPNGVASLTVPDNFYYLEPKDAKTVLVDVWGNPPTASQNTLGMLFPAEMTPFDGDAWGVTIDYEEDGYVSDENADSIDYDDLLSQMKDDTEASSKERARHGYESIQLIGWAAMPYYDASSHKLHWAKEYKFGDTDVNMLNYDIRVLGRKGVLVLSFIASIDQKSLIKGNVNTVLAMAEFDEGSKYSDFDPDIDKVAAYGIGALVAGKVLAKTGLLAGLLIFLKKFGVIILIAGVALIAKLLKRKKAKS
ncbi:MAG: DUF2167 domain-containing protein [Gammaproteobacteria bacterium]|nr:DUF2167 domain-containing protein [Gammaproteobacteria bacterium]